MIYSFGKIPTSARCSTGMEVLKLFYMGVDTDTGEEEISLHIFENVGVAAAE